MVFLMKWTEYRNGAQFYILNSDTDCIGAWHDGTPNVYHSECLESASCMTELLHKLQDKGGGWCVTTDWINSWGETKNTKYPLFQGINRIDGFIPEVCDIRMGETYAANWKVEYISELWYRVSETQLEKVSGFEKNIVPEVEKFIKDNSLVVNEEERR